MMTRAASDAGTAGVGLGSDWSDRTRRPRVLACSRPETSSAVRRPRYDSAASDSGSSTVTIACAFAPATREHRDLRDHRRAECLLGGVAAADTGVEAGERERDDDTKHETHEPADEHAGRSGPCRSPCSTVVAPSVWKPDVGDSVVLQRAQPVDRGVVGLDERVRRIRTGCTKRGRAHRQPGRGLRHRRVVSRSGLLVERVRERFGELVGKPRRVLATSAS